MAEPEKISGDIDAFASASYAVGMDPIDYAEGMILSVFGVVSIVMAARAEAAASFAGLPLDMNREAIARHIIGNLLDAGWKPPEVPGA